MPTTISISHYILPSGLRPLDTGLGRPRDGGGHHQRRADQVRQDPGIPCQGSFLRIFFGNSQFFKCPCLSLNPLGAGELLCLQIS